MTPGGLHPVTAESCELRFGFTQADLLHERCRMRVSRCLSCYKKIACHQPLTTAITFCASELASSIVAASE